MRTGQLMPDLNRRLPARPRQLALVLCLLLLLPALHAYACGGVFGYAVHKKIANNSRAMMAVAIRPGRTTLWTAVEVGGDATDFAWVMPTPEPPDRVQVAHPGLFEWFDEFTAPSVGLFTKYVGGSGISYEDSGCSCDMYPSSGGGGGGGGAAGEDPEVVVVHAMGEAGPFEWMVLGANDAGDMIEWLNKSGYAVAKTDAEALTGYVDRGWSFTVMRVKRPEEAGDMLVPMKLGWPKATVQLPLEIMGGSQLKTVQATVWVLAEQRYEPANYVVARVTNETLQEVTTGQVQQDYDAALDITLAQAGGRAFALEYSGAHPWKYWVNEPRAVDFASEATRVGSNAVLTRLRTRMAPSLLTEDLVLQPSADPSPVTNRYGVSYVWLPDTNSGDASLGVFLLCGLLLGSRRRR